MLTVEVAPLKMPLLVQFPVNVWLTPEPPLNVDPSVIRRSPDAFRFDRGITPPALVFEVMMEESVAPAPTIVISPVPPKLTVPVDRNCVPRSVTEAGDDGLNASVPPLLTVPLLVKDPPNVCVNETPSNAAPFDTMNVPSTVQPISGINPPVLFTWTSVNVGTLISLNVGETVPLKLILPRLLNPEFKSRVCAPVPENVIVPLLAKLPLLRKLPENVVADEPA